MAIEEAGVVHQALVLAHMRIARAALRKVFDVSGLTFD
jgi:hypothetical protein